MLDRPAASGIQEGSGRSASADDMAVRRDWRKAFIAANPAGEITAIRQKTWSSLTAVVREMTFTGTRFEVDRGCDYSRLIVILDEVGDRIHGVEARKQTTAGPEGPHRLYYVPGGAPFWTFAKTLRHLRYISLQFSEADLEALIGDDFDAGLPQTPCLGFADPRLLALAHTFEAECAFDGPSDPLLGDSLSISLLSLLKGVDAMAQPRRHRGGLTARQLKAATSYLQDHLAKKVDPRRLAALTGLSPSHFHRAFKTSTGLPPHTWLIDQRVQRARELMVSSRRSLSEIALETGFSDQSHFTRVFSRRFGVGPAAWRRSVSA